VVVSDHAAASLALYERSTVAAMDATTQQVVAEHQRRENVRASPSDRDANGFGRMDATLRQWFTPD
jgi:hypothetical protein